MLWAQAGWAAAEAGAGEEVAGLAAGWGWVVSAVRGSSWKLCPQRLSQGSAVPLPSASAPAAAAGAGPCRRRGRPAVAAAAASRTQKFFAAGSTTRHCKRWSSWLRTSASVAGASTINSFSPNQVGCRPGAPLKRTLHQSPTADTGLRGEQREQRAQPASSCAVPARTRSSDGLPLVASGAILRCVPTRAAARRAGRDNRPRRRGVDDLKRRLRGGGEAEQAPHERGVGVRPRQVGQAAEVGASNHVFYREESSATTTQRTALHTTAICSMS